MPSSFADIDHLLRRAGFGGSAAEITALSELDWPDAVDQVLDTSTAAPANVALPNLAESETWWNKYKRMTIWWADRSVASSCPIQEKMTLFWHGHLCSSIKKVHTFQHMFDQNQLFRSHGMGSFTELVQLASVQPAMLLYLDNASNEKGSPNENFARELMELFTLGVGQFSEDDVRASARAWTGHGLNSAATAYEFHPEDHDAGSKTFMGVSQNWDGPDIINHLGQGAPGQQSARFISTKLWEFFVYSNPSDELTQALATEFFNSGLNIKTLLRAIFMRPEFRSDQARYGLVRGPFDYMIALMRRTGIDSSSINAPSVTSHLGQGLFDPPNVAGWKQNEEWISASNLWGKRALVNHVRWYLYKKPGVLDADFDTASAAVDAALTYFGLYNASPTTRANLEDYYNSESASWARRAGLLLLTPLAPEFQMA